MGAKLDGMTGLRRTHACGALRTDAIGTEVVVAGWVHRRRDHGGLIFVDLRDREGLVQVVFRPEQAPEVHARAHDLRSEWVVAVRGTVERRSPETVNADLATGEVEIAASELRVLNTATPPPFPIEDDAEIAENTRLEHRLHDLRRPVMQRNMRVRHELAQAARRTLSALGFLEIETPMLARSTPEGARDVLVPSRLQPGEFYALPQSPQLMKQMFMIAGFDRYFQIARCFRDEDGRADRQLEFTQIDLELSFCDVEEVLAVLEEVTAECARSAAGVELARPFRRISYREAMDRFGIDRPDTRIRLELVDLTDVFATSEFRAFRGAVDAGGIVKCLPIADAGDALSRSEIDRLESFVRKELGAKGLGWIRIQPDGTWQSPIAKFLSDDDKARITERTGAKPGHVLFFQADAADKANAILARLRVDLGQRLGRVEDRPWDVLIVVDFPVFERDEKGALTYVHQPFVAPVDEDVPLLWQEPERVRGTHYDVVLNGVELGSGSLRNHRSDVQRRILEVMGYSPAEMEERFGFLLRALDAGAPPHGGFAFGFDRFAMVLCGADNLRDVLAFPKTQRGQDLLMQSPSPVAREQLDELSLRVVARPKA
ncbi:MAG: aspartate--tRNA ligase [Myxococcales bacterium]|nr:aspartate--tRNA ligase [Myxococcales bacterium]